MLKKISLLLCLFSLPTFADVTNLDNEGLKRLMDENVPVIDIRRPEEWQQTGIIANSHLITFFDNKGNYDIDAWTVKLNHILEDDKKKPFVLICRTGNRTGRVSQFLDAKLDYTHVYNVKKGITEWIKQKEAVVKPELESKEKDSTKK